MEITEQKRKNPLYFIVFAKDHNIDTKLDYFVFKYSTAEKEADFKEYLPDKQTNITVSHSSGNTYEVSFMPIEADQVTFRKIYTDGENKEAIWVKNHEFPEEKFNEIKKYIKENGNPIVMLPYGHIQYGIDDMSVVIDDNCMSKNNILDMKYAILRPNGHLYSRWDDKGSLIF